MKVSAKRTNHNLAEHLKMARKERELTMAELANILGTKQSLIGKVELRHRRLDIGEFVYYCRALGKDPVKELRKVAAY